MKIGTDVNLRTCLAEGYLMMEFKKRDLFPKHLNGKMNTDYCVEFTATMGHISHTSDGYIKEPGTPRHLLYSVDTCHTFETLMEMYNQYRDSINQMCGMTHEERCLDDPNEYTFLHLASDVNAYCGLE